MARLGTFRRDTAANWELVNPVIADGEFILVATDPLQPKFYNEYKVGDGTSVYTALAFRGLPAVNSMTNSVSDVPSTRLLQTEFAKAESYNVTTRVPLSVGQYYDLASAIAVVPTANRKVGLKLTYLAALYEKDTLTVSTIPTTAGNITLILNGIAFTVAIDPTTDTTTTLVADKIRATSYTGWTISGTGATVVFTKNAIGVCAAPVFNAGTTGATASFIRTVTGSAEFLTEMQFTGNSTATWTTQANWRRVANNDDLVQLGSDLNKTISDSVLTGKIFNNVNLTGAFLTNAQIISKAISSLYLYGSGIESNALYSLVVASNTTSYRKLRIFKSINSTNTEVCQLSISQSVIKTGIESVVIPAYNSSNVYAKVIVNWDILSGQDILSLYADKWIISDRCKNEAFFNNSYFNAVNINTNWSQNNIILDCIADSTFMGVADEEGKPFATLEGTRVTNGIFSDVGGFLKSVTFRADRVGTIKVKFYEKIGTNLVWQNEVIIAAKIGLNTYYAGIDFTPINIDSGWYIGAYSADGVKIPYITSNGTYNSLSVAGDNITYIDYTGGWIYQYSIAINAKIARSISEIDAIKTQLSNIEKEILTTKSTLFYSDFREGIPTGFVQSGGWTTSLDGLKSPITGGWGVWAYYDVYTTLDKATVRARIKISDVTSKFALIRKTKSLATGNIGVIDCANKKLQILKSWDGTSANIPDVAIETNITFDFVANREYLVELIKDTVQKSILKITDTITNDTVQVISDYNVTTSFWHGAGWDSPGIISVNGDITVKKFEYISNAPTKPILAIYSDSFVEASSILGSVDSRYASKISNALNGNCLICGKGGENSTGLLLKLQTDFMNFSPKYTLIAIGTNDYNYATWLANMQAAIEVVESRNSIPILGTITIRLDTDHSAFTFQANAWIRSSGYKYVDFNLVTTVNNDGVTQDTTLFQIDKVHPTIACHDILYKKFLVDCPEVFDEQ